MTELKSHHPFVPQATASCVALLTVLQDVWRGRSVLFITLLFETLRFLMSRKAASGKHLSFIAVVVLVTVLPLRRDMMAKSAYKMKHLTEGFLTVSEGQFTVITVESSGGGLAGIALERQLRAYILIRRRGRDRRRGREWCVHVFRNLKAYLSLPPIRPHLLIISKQFTNWDPNFQVYEPIGAIFI